MLTTLMTAACAHQPYYYHGHSAPPTHSSGRITIWDDNFSLNFSYSTPRHYHRDYGYDYYQRERHYHNRSATTCRGPWGRSSTRYHHSGTLMRRGNRSCIIPISPVVKTPTYQSPAPFISGGWCVHQTITRINVRQLELREHRFSPPINCFN